MVKITLIALFLALAPPAMAGAVRAEVVEGPKAYRYHASWADRVGKAREVRAILPRGATEDDLEAPLKFPMKRAANAQAAAVTQWGRSLPAGSSVQVEVLEKGALKIGAVAPTPAQAKQIIEEGQRVAQKELKRFAREEGFLVDNQRVILPDHAREVRSSARALSPLAEALAEGLPNQSPRVFAEKALAFVQSIPYEARPNGNDAGFRRPMAVLVKNKGDCDGKAVLFLGLMRARYPDLPMSVLIVPGHALVGVALQPKPGERVLQFEGRDLVVMEPVGPALSPIGDPSPLSKNALQRGDVEIYPVDPAR